MQGETVTRLRVTSTTDAWNNVVPGDWSTAARLDIPHCAVAPHASTEDNVGRTAVITGLDVYMPTGTDLLPTDRLEVRGGVYEVVGDVADWRNPFTGARPGMVAVVQRVEG